MDLNVKISIHDSIFGPLIFEYFFIKNLFEKKNIHVFLYYVLLYSQILFFFDFNFKSPYIHYSIFMQIKLRRNTSWKNLYNKVFRFFQSGPPTQCASQAIKCTIIRETSISRHHFHMIASSSL